MRIFLGVALLGLTGCVTNVYDSTQEGKTIMDGNTCQNGVCTHVVKESPKKVLQYWTKERMENAKPMSMPQYPST
jgi:hypothetical protein